MEMVKENKEDKQLQADSISITYFTDPLCCWSWAFEPEWRKLLFEYQGLITWNYRMGGLLPAWKNFNDPVNSVTRPVQMGPVWMHASQLSGMPMQHAIWMKDAPASSYPACIAVKCAQLQAAYYGEQYLRLLREAVMLNGINIAKETVLIEMALELEKQSTGFNTELFKKHLYGREGLEAFKQDMQQVKNYNISRFPTLIFKYKNQHPLIITGYRPYTSLIDALHQLVPDIKPAAKAVSAEEYQSYWLTVTARETEEALKEN